MRYLSPGRFWPAVLKPFCAEIRSVPRLKSRLHPVFIRECRDALQLCKNLRTFSCTVPGILSIFLPSLARKECLQSLRIHANLTTDQAKMLAQFDKLQNLSIEFATWNVADMLPSWSQSISKTLSDLTLFVRGLSRYIFPSHFFVDGQRSA